MIVSERSVQLDISTLQTAGERLETIFQSLSDGLIVIDSEERILFFNPAAETILGCRQIPLFIGSLGEYIEDRRLLKRFRLAAGAKRESFECEVAGGETPMRVVAVEAIAVNDGTGSRVGTAFVLRDITYQRELDRLKSEFICTAAHELRTPLTSILGFSDLLLARADLPAEQQRDFLGYIRQKAESLATLISDLLDLSRIEAGRGLSLSREACRIGDLLEETALTWNIGALPHRMEIVRAEPDPVLYIDRVKIVQVLENLVSNAVKYSPRGGRSNSAVPWCRAPARSPCATRGSA